MTGVIFRDPRKAQLAFSQDADYLFDPQADVIGDDPDIGHRTFECTKRGMAMTLYACLRTYGEAAFAEHLDAVLDASEAIASVIEASDDFELAYAPRLNILCFRPCDRSIEISALRQRVVDSGEYYIVETRMEGESWLRLTVIEGEGGKARAQGLLDACRRHLE